MDERIQENATVEDGHEAKYVVAARLRFVRYDPDEIDSGILRVGDVLEVLPTNGCGLGIAVRRVCDGVHDMVWPISQ